MAGEGSRKTQFKPGRSGNPRGRPRGSRSKRLAILDSLGDAAARAIVVAVIAAAKGGDVMAARAVLKRVWPARKGAKVTFDLPVIAKADELPAAIAGINRQVAEGRLSLEEGTLALGLLEAQRKALETGELEARIRALEESMGWQ